MTREEALHIAVQIKDYLCEGNPIWDVGMIAEAMDMAIKALEEQKTSRWIPQVGGGYCCSKCGRYALHDVDGNFALLFTKSKYCPNCGAKMEGERDG